MYIAIGVILSLIFGYLLGSISHGVLIGKIFFGVDVRESGSKNSGGTNTGRVLGKKIGLITILLDMLKCTLAIWITYFICKIDFLQELLVINPSYYGFIAGAGACLGHTFPIFFGFKGNFLERFHKSCVHLSHSVTVCCFKNVFFSSCCMTIFDIAPADLSPMSREEMLGDMLQQTKRKPYDLQEPCGECGRSPDLCRL